MQKTRSWKVVGFSWILLFLASSVKAGVPGDVDRDGQVTLRDVVITLKAVVGSPPPNVDLSLADIAPLRPDGTYGDGKITLEDALLLLKRVVGLMPPLPEKPSPPSDKGDPSSVYFSGNSDSTLYTPGTPVTFTLRLINRGKTPVKLTFPTSQLYDIVLFNSEGKEVWRWSDGRAFLMVITERELPPGKELTWTERWDQKDNRGNAVPKGLYRVRYLLTDVSKSFRDEGLFLIRGEREVRPVDYIPLALRGTWTFENTRAVKGWMFPIRISVLDTQFPADPVTEVLATLSRPPDRDQQVRWRVFAEGRVFELTDSGGVERYRLGAPEGETWEYPAWYMDTRPIIKVTMASRKDSLETPKGKFTHLLRIEFNPGCCDWGWVEWWAPGMGLVGFDLITIAGPQPYRLAHFEVTP